MHHDNSFLRLEKTELIVGPDMDLVESPEVSLTKGSLDWIKDTIQLLTRERAAAYIGRAFTYS